MQVDDPYKNTALRFINLSAACACLLFNAFNNISAPCVCSCDADPPPNTTRIKNILLRRPRFIRYVAEHSNAHTWILMNSNLNGLELSSEILFWHSCGILTKQHVVRRSQMFLSFNCISWGWRDGGGGVDRRFILER